jgi:Domain of unknown function (DUF4403)
MRSFMRLTPVTLLMPLLILVGCSHTIPASDRVPQPPPQIGKSPPTLAPLNASEKHAQTPESILPVQRAIQAAVPERFSDVDQPITNPLASGYRWQFVREGEPEVIIQDGLVKYQAVYRGEIESRAARSCRLDPLFPVLEGTGRLMLREQDQALLVMMSDSTITINLKPESDSKCNMFNSAVNDQLAELFRQDMINQQIGKSVESYSIPIQLVWDRLQEPMTVGQANSLLCLYGKAQDFTIGPFKGPAQQTTISGLARETPTALYQTPCQKSVTSPPLKVHTDNTAVAAQEGQPYKILLTVPVPYAVLTQQLQDKLFHQEIKLPTTINNAFNNTLTIERAFASDVNGRTLLSMETSGAVIGTLYYWGTPRLEHEGNVITIPDLQMANETKMALDEVKAGYWQTVDDELGPRLRLTSMIELARQIGSMKSALSGQYKSGDLAMNLLMGRQEAGQVSSTKDALIADVVVGGTASVSGRVPIKQQAQNDQTEKKLLMEAPADNKPRSSDRISEYRSSDGFPGQR